MTKLSLQKYNVKNKGYENYKLIIWLHFIGMHSIENASLFRGWHYFHIAFTYPRGTKSLAFLVANSS